ncbi:MAG: tetratricopeptide repeat protein, partial [Planctomycetia bacterium]|nr:tetratricopeptide repeat protein [Planctomycetia bacterium]
VEPELLDRKQQVVRDFERKRDEAEYAAAYDRWQVKDYAGCREGLNSLLKRNPKHADGQKLLARLEKEQTDSPVATAPDNSTSKSNVKTASAQESAAEADLVEADLNEAQLAAMERKDLAGAKRFSMAAKEKKLAEDSDGEFAAAAEPASDSGVGLSGQRRPDAASKTPLLPAAISAAPPQPAIADSQPPIMPISSAPRSSVPDSNLVDQPEALPINGARFPAPLADVSSASSPSKPSMPVAKAADEPRADPPQYARATDWRLETARPAPPDPNVRKPTPPRELANYDGGAQTPAAREHVQKAVTALLARDPAQAAREYEAAAAAEPANPRILTAAVAMSIRHAQSGLSLQLAKSAVSQYPDDASAFRALGTACYRHGDYQAARGALQKAISLDNAHPLSYFLMGSTLARLGDTEGAAWNFKQARQLDPKYAEWR